MIWQEIILRSGTVGNFFQEQPIYYNIQGWPITIKEIKYPNGQEFVLTNSSGEIVDIGRIIHDPEKKSFVVQGSADRSWQNIPLLDVNRTFNVPINVVIKQVSPAKNITLVFNGSAKYENGVDASNLGHFVGNKVQTYSVSKGYGYYGFFQ